MHIGRTVLSGTLLLFTACAPSGPPPSPTLTAVANADTATPVRANTPAPQAAANPVAATPLALATPTSLPTPSPGPTAAPTLQPRQSLQPVVDAVAAQHKGMLGIVVKHLASGDNAR